MQSDLAKTVTPELIDQIVGAIEGYAKVDGEVDFPLAAACLALTNIADLLRTGKLIALPDDAAGRMARAISVCADKLNEDAPDTCGRLSFVLNRSDQFATAALAALTKGTDHAG